MTMENNAILKFTVSVTAVASQETKDLLKKLEDAKSTLTDSKDPAESDQSEEQVKGTIIPESEMTPEEHEAYLDSLNKSNVTKKQDEFLASGNVNNFQKDPAFKELQDQKNKDDKLKQDVLETLNKLDTKGLQTLYNFSVNPTASVLGQLTKALSAVGPEAQIIIAVVTMAISAPQVIQAIIKALSVKGGPLNRDWKRLVSQEVDAGLSRQLVKQRELGIDQVILNQQR